MRLIVILLLLLSGQSARAQLADFGAADFRRADSLAAAFDGETLENLPFLTYQLTESLDSELEQFRAIYRWVCANIHNDYDGYSRNQRKQRQLQNDSLALANWNARFRSELFENLRKRQKTVCTGYSYLIREMANMAGIECEIIEGYGRTVKANIGAPGIPNHSWNAVRLEGRWYLCDATWSSGHTTYPEFSYVHEYNDGYFLADPRLFVLNHYPFDPAWTLLDHPPTLTHFLYGPLIYKSAFNYGMIPHQPARMEVSITKNEQLVLLFKVPDSLPIAEIRLEIAGHSTSIERRPEVRSTTAGLLEIRQGFNRRNQHDVHLKIGEHYIATYVVRVK